MKENKKDMKKIILIICLVVFFIIGVTIGLSYAYFTASVVNKTTPTSSVIETGTMALEFTDGAEVKLENAYPASQVTKTFSVKNTGNVKTSYDVYLSELLNNFVDKSDLVYTLTSLDGGYNIITQTQVPDQASKIVQNQEIDVNETHHYTLIITFKETNDNQDDNANKIFSAKISINEYKNPFTLVDYITNLSEPDLLNDPTVDNNLRYVGSNPNNYIKFNNELWRIIGVMNNVEVGNGEKKSLLKIVKNESLGNYSWDSNDNKNDRGINQWGESNYEDESIYEGADLMRELNNDYLGNITVGIDNEWYAGTSNTKHQKSNSQIDNISQEMIESVKYNLGSLNHYTGEDSWNINNLLTPSFIYNNERQDNNGKKCTSTTYCSDTVIRTTKWLGKIAVIYPSDYAYATSGGTTTDRDTCLSLNLMYSGWGSSSYKDCKNNNWLNKNDNYWTLSPAEDNYGNHNVYEITNSGSIMYVASSNPFSIYPTLYLKSNVLLAGGDGTSENPYIISM